MTGPNKVEPAAHGCNSWLSVWTLSCRSRYWVFYVIIGLASLLYAQNHCRKHATWRKKISCIHTPREKQNPAPTSTFLTRICYQEGLQVIRTVHEMVKNARKCMNGLKTKITMPLPNQPKVKWFTPYWGPSIKPGTWNIPEHPGTLNNYNNYEKQYVKLNFQNYSFNWLQWVEAPLLFRQLRHVALQ